MVDQMNYSVKPRTQALPKATDNDEDTTRCSNRLPCVSASTSVTASHLDAMNSLAVFMSTNKTLGAIITQESQKKRRMCRRSTPAEDDALMITIRYRCTIFAIL